MHVGPLKSVGNLSVTFINSTTVLISWSPPFTLEGVSILGYNVTIININTTSGKFHNDTIFVEGDSTILYYRIEYQTSSLIIIVVPINEGGAGIKSTYNLVIPYPIIATSKL